MSTQRNVLHGPQWTATPNGNKTGELLQEFRQRSFWRWLLPHKEDLIVAGREIKGGWVIPQPLGVALIVFMLGGVGGIYWRTSDRIDSQNAAQTKKLDEQKELIIRLDQRLIDKGEAEKKDAEELSKRLQNIDAVQTVLGRDIAKLQAKGIRN